MNFLPINEPINPANAIADILAVGQTFNIFSCDASPCEYRVVVIYVTPKLRV